MPLRLLLDGRGPAAARRATSSSTAPTISAASPYYESIDLVDAFHPQTILAWAMNDRPLEIGHGAPLRLRVERQLGYKHAKFVMRIEAVAEPRRDRPRQGRLLGGSLRLPMVCRHLTCRRPPPRIPKPLVDSFGRRISYVRLSVTDRCDLRCRYCMAETMRFLPRSDILTLEEIEALADIFIARGVTRIRLTGGEPLVRRGIEDLVGRLGARIGHGLDELTLTTNGTQLARYAARLHEAGIRRVNVSLDSRREDRFRHITRGGDLGQVLAGIDAAAAAGLRIKINMVAPQGPQRGRDRRHAGLVRRPRLRPHPDRDDAARRGRGGPDPPLSAAGLGPARGSRSASP